MQHKIFIAVSLIAYFPKNNKKQLICFLFKYMILLGLAKSI